MVHLSKSEYKVAELVACGFIEKEIGDKLCISPKTVHNHTYNIRKKLGARTAVDIARMFILDLEHPRKFFAAMLFLTIQFHIMGFFPEMDLRKTAKTSIRANSRNAKKRTNEYHY